MMERQLIKTLFTRQELCYGFWTFHIMLICVLKLFNILRTLMKRVDADECNLNFNGSKNKQKPLSKKNQHYNYPVLFDKSYTNFYELPNPLFFFFKPGGGHAELHNTVPRVSRPNSCFSRYL